MLHRVAGGITVSEWLRLSQLERDNFLREFDEACELDRVNCAACDNRVSRMHNTREVKGWVYCLRCANQAEFLPYRRPWWLRALRWMGRL